jgi:hypothetical protein
MVAVTRLLVKIIQTETWIALALWAVIVGAIVRAGVRMWVVVVQIRTSYSICTTQNKGIQRVIANVSPYSWAGPTGAVITTRTAPPSGGAYAVIVTEISGDADRD